MMYGIPNRPIYFYQKDIIVHYRHCLLFYPLNGLDNLQITLYYTIITTTNITITKLYLTRLD